MRWQYLTQVNWSEVSTADPGSHFGTTVAVVPDHAGPGPRLHGGTKPEDLAALAETAALPPEPASTPITGITATPVARGVDSQ